VITCAEVGWNTDSWVVGCCYYADGHVSTSVLDLLVRPEAIACGADLSFSPDVFFYFLFFFRAWDLQDAWANRLEILHDGQY